MDVRVSLSVSSFQERHECAASSPTVSCLRLLFSPRVAKYGRGPGPPGRGLDRRGTFSKQDHLFPFLFLLFSKPSLGTRSSIRRGTFSLSSYFFFFSISRGSGTRLCALLLYEDLLGTLLEPYIKPTRQIKVTTLPSKLPLPFWKGKHVLVIRAPKRSRSRT